MIKPTKIIDEPKTDKFVLEKINSLIEKRYKFKSHFSKELGFTSQYVGGIMKGSRGLSVNLLIKILDVAPASLLPGKDENDLNLNPLVEFIDSRIDRLKEELKKYIDGEFLKNKINKGD